MARLGGFSILASVAWAVATPAQAGPNVFWTFGFNFRPSNVRTNPVGGERYVGTAEGMELRSRLTSATGQPEPAAQIAVNTNPLQIPTAYVLTELVPAG